MPVNTDRLNEFLGRFVNDLGAAVHAGMVVIRDRLGLYKALVQKPMIAAELAKQTKTDERYVREWAASQAAGGYLTYAPKTQQFGMTEEQVLTWQGRMVPRTCPARSNSRWDRSQHFHGSQKRFGPGPEWGGLSMKSVFHGCEKFFRPGYAANLITSWIPSLDGVKEKLARGAKVADVGCGKGASTILVAKAFPKSEFHGFDYHDKSIDLARASARQEGVADHVSFEVAAAKQFPGKDYDFVSVFDCLHDMGDPVGAAAHVRRAIKNDGSWMMVEPFANDELHDNVNPVGLSTIPFRRCYVHPVRARKKWGYVLALKLARSECGRWSIRLASPASGAPPKHLSIWYMKSDRELQYA